MNEFDFDGLGAVLDRYVPELLTVIPPGLVVATADSGGLVNVRAYGYRRLSDNSPMLPDTVVRAGSLGKPLVGAASLLLVERGQLDLDEPLSTYLGDLDLSNPHGGEPITARLALTHTSGLRLDSFAASREMPPPLPEFLFHAFESGGGSEYGGHGALWAGKAGEMRFSNCGFALIGHLVSTIDGRPYEEFVLDEILRPLGMHDTWVGPPGHEPERLTARLATGYSQWGDLLLPEPQIYSAVWPASSILTTMPDQARWLTTLLTGEIEGHRLFAEPETFSRFRTWQTAANFPDPSLGCGLALQIGDSRTPGYAVGHEGAYPSCGWGNSYAYPHQGIGVAAYGNNWNIKDYVVPAGRRAPMMVADLIRRWSAGYRPDTESFVTLPEATSWTAGVKVAERMIGLIGAESFGDDEIKMLVSAVRSSSGRHGDFVPDAFIDGVSALNAAGLSGAKITELIASLPVSAEMRNLAALAAGESDAVFPEIVEAFAGS